MLYIAIQPDEFPQDKVETAAWHDARATSTLGGDLLTMRNSNQDSSLEQSKGALCQALKDLAPNSGLQTFGILQLMKVSSTNPQLVNHADFRSDLAAALKQPGQTIDDYPLSQDALAAIKNSPGSAATAQKLVESGFTEMRNGDRMKGILAFLQAAQLDPAVKDKNRFVSRLSELELQPDYIDPKSFPKK